MSFQLEDRSVSLAVRAESARAVRRASERERTRCQRWNCETGPTALPPALPEVVACCARASATPRIEVKRRTRSRHFELEKSPTGQQRYPARVVELHELRARSANSRVQVQASGRTHRLAAHGGPSIAAVLSPKCANQAKQRLFVDFAVLLLLLVVSLVRLPVACPFGAHLAVLLPASFRLSALLAVLLLVELLAPFAGIVLDGSRRRRLNESGRVGDSDSCAVA